MIAVEEQTGFAELLPQLIDQCALPQEEVSRLQLLADRTNRLTPAFAQLSDHIWSALPVTDVSQLPTHTALAQQVAATAGTLSSKQQEVRKFVESICFEAVEVRVRGQHIPEARADALRSARQPLIHAVQQVTRPLTPALTAELIAQPLPEIVPVVNRWFRDSCHTIAAQLLLSLHVLVELDVIGLVEWPNETTCKLHFFRHIVTQDEVRTERTERVSSFSDGDGERIRFESWEQVQGRNRYAVERHEHHVMNARVHPVEQAQYPIPADKQAFLDQVPDWIHSHLRILEGDQFVESIVRQDVREEQWQTTPALRSSFELEPAILLGHYVITGWGEKEIRREQSRRINMATQEPPPAPANHKQRVEAGKTYGSLRPWTIASAAAATALMLFSRLQPAAMVPLVVLLTLVAITVCGRCVMNFSQWKHATIDWLFVTAASVSAAGGLFAIQSFLYGILYGQWPMLGMAVTVGIVASVAFGLAGARLEE